MNGLFLLNMCKSCFVFFKLGRNQISTLSSPNSLLSRSQILLLTSSWQLDVLMLVEGWWHMMVPGITTRLAAQHSCQSAPQCPLALMNCFSSYQRTRSILPHCGGDVEQTNMICHHLFAWLYWWQCTSGFAVKWFSGCEWWRGSRCC